MAGSGVATGVRPRTAAREVETVKAFKAGKRVVVKPEVKDFAGAKGEVQRVASDGTAWVALDKWPKGTPRLFPKKGDPRSNHVKLEPSHCDEL